MKQQVNLYHKSLSNSDHPDIYKYLLVLGFLIFALLIYTFSLAFDISELKDKKTNITLQLQGSQANVKIAQAQYPKKQINTLLNQKITQKLDLRSSLSGVIDLLTDEQSDKTQGFSRYFAAFAKQSVNGLWFTTIYIDAEQENIFLYGRTHNRETLPMLFRKLQQEPIFKGKVFSKLEMKQSKEQTKLLDFFISTTTEMPKEKENDNE